MSVIQSPYGTPVLTLGDDDIVGGYLLTVYDEGGRLWRRQVAESLYVDGAYESSAVLAGQTLNVEVYIEGTDWAQVGTRRDALLDAVEVPLWRLVVAGVTWVCDPADSMSPMPPQGTESTWRVVSLTIPARPSRGV